MINRSSEIKKKLLDYLDHGHVTMGDEIEILQYIVKRLNLATPAERARELGVSDAGMKKRLDSGKEAFVLIGNKRFVV